jgi:hypothetical protein
MAGFLARVCPLAILSYHEGKQMMQLTSKTPLTTGNLNTRISLQAAPINGITVQSEPTFLPEIDTEFTFRSNNVHVDPSMEYARINVQAVLENSDDALISYNYEGIIDMTLACVTILVGSPDTKTTEFGHVFTHVDFETGAGHLKILKASKDVGLSSFVVGSARPVVESRISRVTYGIEKLYSSKIISVAVCSQFLPPILHNYHAREEGNSNL